MHIHKVDHYAIIKCRWAYSALLLPMMTWTNQNAPGVMFFTSQHCTVSNFYSVLVSQWPFKKGKLHYTMHIHLVTAHIAQHR